MKLLRPINNLAWKNLGYWPQFKMIDNEDLPRQVVDKKRAIIVLFSELPDFIKNNQDANKDGLIGYFENHPNSAKDCILICNRGIYIYDEHGESQEIQFLNCDNVEIPSEKSHWYSVVIKTVSGKEIPIPVLPDDGNRRSASSMHRFFSHAVGEVKFADRTK